jgi:hypothetical protein
MFAVLSRSAEGRGTKTSDFAIFNCGRQKNGATLCKTYILLLVIA